MLNFNGDILLTDELQNAKQQNKALRDEMDAAFSEIQNMLVFKFC